MESYPYRIIEGVTIAAYVVGASEGRFYIRSEYPLAVRRMSQALENCCQRGLLGDNIIGSDFSLDLKIVGGAGAFVCGEETALMASIEGKRGEPRQKPPFPSDKGLYGKPTIINNVETFANVPVIVLKGPEWFASIGSEKSKGTKGFALSGKVNKVGFIEISMGTTLREIVFDKGGGIQDGRKFKAVQTGGPSGGVITEENLDTPIDYDSLNAIGSMMGSGGMIVMDESDCMVSIAKFYLDFTLEESCGKCTPCRVGNKRLYELLDKITQGKGEELDIEKLKDLSLVIKDTALCVLGQTSPNPVLSTIKNFEHEYKAHVLAGKCPAGQCKSLLRYDIIEDLCTGCTLCFRNCPVGAISGERRAPHFIDQTLCIKCGVCFEKCKFNAITLT